MGAMMMDTMMIDTVNDEMPVMMMTENTMLLSPAVTAPEFRGQLFDALVYDLSAYYMEKDDVIFQDDNGNHNYPNAFTILSFLFKRYAYSFHVITSFLLSIFY